MRNRNAVFRELLVNPGTSFICEAHNGISAKIVEEAGFSGIWASGLSISAQYGVRDNNEASWSQVLDAVEFMSDATTIPILVDGDTGFGNFNNFRKFVRKLEQVGVSGVCIEDKLFPKKNSFIDGSKQELADIDEFCGKIRAGKDYQLDDQFTIVARVEALIAGWGIEEAIRRANAYADAGADAVLIHSSKKDASEIFTFMDKWDSRCPVVIVPTTYFTTETSEFIKHNISLVIWANHMIRSSIKAMQEVASRIYSTQSLIGLDDLLVPVSEIFRLQNNDELEKAEAKYLPKNTQGDAFLLSAGGKDIRNVLGKQSLTFEQYVLNYRKNGISNIHLIVEGEESTSDLFFDSVITLKKPSSSEFGTLNAAMEKINAANGNIVVAYADTTFENHFLIDEREFESFDAIILGSYFNTANPNKKDSYDVIKIENNFDYELYTRFLVNSIENRREVKSDEFIWSGLLVISSKSKQRFIEIMKTFSDLSKDGSIPDLINAMIENRMKIGLRITFTRWLEFGDKSFRVSG